MRATLSAAAVFSLLAASAYAADLGVPPVAPPIPPPFTWTSCYGGVQGGGGWGQTSLNDSALIISGVSGFTSAGTNIGGYLLGGQIGCDYQFAHNWVAGVEGSAAWTNIAGSVGVGAPGLAFPDSATFTENSDLLTSVTGRFGYAWDNWLLYGKAGGAWTANRYSAFDAAATYAFQGLETRFGWTAGVGVEWAFSPNWSVKLEYDYYGFGARSVTFVDSITGTVGPLNITQNIQVVKLGVDLHVFGPTIAPLTW